MHTAPEPKSTAQNQNRFDCSCLFPHKQQHQNATDKAAFYLPARNNRPDSVQMLTASHERLGACSRQEALATHQHPHAFWLPRFER